MKNIFFLLSVLAISIITHAQNSAEKIAIIPIPVSMQVTGDAFLLPSNIVIGSNNQSAEVQQVISQFSEKLTPATGFTVTRNNTSPSVVFNINDKPDAIIGDEGYHLTVTNNQVTINANKPAGLFYGTQTLLQLLPPEILSKQ